jgi:tRNA(Ile)-lysidine synthetase-like protein
MSEKSGTKSLKKLFIEKKIPAHVRDSIPIIADDVGPLAIPGIGCSLRVKPEDGDKILNITFEEIKNYECY